MPSRERHAGPAVVLAAVQDVAPAAGGQLDRVAVAADRRRDEHVAAAQERERRWPASSGSYAPANAGARVRRSTSARMISHSLRVRSDGAAPRRSSSSSAAARAPSRPARRLSGSTSESDSSSSPW